MSYVYRERERDRDFDDRNVTIKRYVIPSEDRDDRREFAMSRDDYGDREMVVRRHTERDEPFTMSRYERDVEYDAPVRRYEREYYERKLPGPSSTTSTFSYHSSRPPEYLERPMPPHVRGPMHGPAHGPVHGPMHGPPHGHMHGPMHDPTHGPMHGPIHGPMHGPMQDRRLTPHHEARYVSPRQSEYDVESEYYRRRYDDRHSRRDLSPGDSISQTSRRRGRNRDAGYSSDDEYYYHEETRTYDGDHPHHRRHMAEGALVGVGAAELIRSHRKREGEEVSHGASHAMKTAGAGALGAVAVNAASHVRDYYRSKSRSRHRSHSFDDERSYRHGRHSHSRSRSKSHSRAKTLMEVGLGAAAIAAGVAAMRNNNKSADERRSRSRTRTRSQSRSRAGTSTTRDGKERSRSMSQRRKHIAGAGLAGAAVAGLVEHHRSKSRSRKGERSRSHSRLRKALPVVAAGLGTAAVTGLYEKNKANKEGKDGRGRSRSKSRSRGGNDIYPDPTRDSAGLIEYGKDPVNGSIPTEHYYGAPSSSDPAYFSDGGEYSRRPSRTRSRSRGARYSGSSSGSDRESRRRHRKHRSRSRDLAGAALGATGLGYAAHKISQSRERKKAEREQERTRKFVINLVHTEVPQVGPISLTDYRV